MRKRYTDLHMHPSMKPYNAEGHADEAYGVLNSNPWKENAELNYRNKPNRKLGAIAWGVIKNTVRFSQTYLGLYRDAAVPGGIAVLHPVERGWFDYTEKEPAFQTRGHRIRKFILDRILPPKKYKYLAATMSGIPTGKITPIIDRVEAGLGVDYFRDELFREYAFLRKWTGQTGENSGELILPKDYAEWKAVAEEHAAGASGKVALIFAVEGGHALTNVPRSKFFRLPYEAMPRLDRELLATETLNNVARLKGAAGTDGTFSHSLHPDHAPIYVTLAHFFNNFLCGHCKTFGDGSVQPVVPGMSDLLHQEVGMDRGITDLGWRVIQALLSRTNGKRVLVDVKHMSVRSREEYYHWLKTEMSAEEIPILFSHGGVAGEEEAPAVPDSMPMDKKTYFSRWSINANDRDIVEVIRSGGLFGLAPHEGRLPGGASKKDLSKLRKRSKDPRTNEILRKSYARMLWSNLIRIQWAWRKVAPVGQEEKAWDHVTLGSDYDGMMDPFDSYLTFRDLDLLRSDLLHFINAVSTGSESLVLDAAGAIEVSGPEVAQYFTATDYETVLEKFFFGNFDAFLKRYFNDAYRLQGNPQPV